MRRSGLRLQIHPVPGIGRVLPLLLATRSLPAGLRPYGFKLTDYRSVSSSHAVRLSPSAGSACVRRRDLDLDSFRRGLVVSLCCGDRARGWRVGLQFLAVNWLAVSAAAVVNMVVGFLWYGPLFSGLFLRLIGKRKDESEASPLVYPLGFVMGLVTTYVLAVIIGSAGVTTWWGGAVTGAVV